ncbi:MAG: hypothetical protein WCS89_04185 [Candidatus Paceibacterota bacterium]|jgi:hypothetical protein
MNYNKLKELFVRYKKYAIVGVILAFILIVYVVSSRSGDNEMLKLNSSGDYSSKNVGLNNNSGTGEIQEYDYTEAMDHIGEKAVVKGKVVKVFTSKSNTTFLDFCPEFNNCSFSAVIFASDLKKFKDVKSYEREVKITGLIKSYNGKAEIILDGPEQVE